MKPVGSFPINTRNLPYVEAALHYGLMALAFCLLFVNLHNISEYVFIGLLILWVVTKLWVGPFAIERTPLDLPLLLFLCWILLTIPFATDWTYSLEEWRKTIPRFLMFWFVVNVVRTERQVRDILLSFSVGLLFLSFLEASYFFIQAENVFSMETRAGSLTGSSQWFSNYLVIGVPLLCLGFMCDRRLFVRVAYSLALGFAAIGLFLAHTRAAWVAILFQIFVYGLWKFSRSWIVTGVVALLMLGLLLAFMTLPGQHLALLFQNEFTNPYTMSIRYNTWNVAIDDIRDHPITGIGYGKHSFRMKHPDLKKEDFHTHVHNSFLSHATQIGIPGLVFLLWVFWRLLKHLIQRLERDSDTYQGKLALALLLMTIGIIVRNMFDDMLGGTVTYLFWLLIGVSFYAYKSRTFSEQESVSENRLA